MSKKRSDKSPRKDDNQVSMPDEQLTTETTNRGDDFEALLVEWLNNPPERTRRSVVLPAPPYIDRTIDDRQRFMERAKPKVTKDVLKQIIRGKSKILDNSVTKGRDVSALAQAVLAHDMFRNCLVSTGDSMVYVPYAGNNLRKADIDVPIGIGEPNWWPGRDGGGGGGGFEGGSDPSDIVYMPMTYEEFIEMLQLLFDLPFLKQTAEDKLLVYSIKMRGLSRSGPRARLDIQATAVARLERFRATYNARPDEFPDLTTDSNPTPEQFPFHNLDLRYKRVEEQWDPDSKAVMFMNLDTSGSMGGEPLAMSKFYFLLNLIWLRTRYNDVSVVYIAHNARAERIRQEQDFFRISEGGGTMFVPTYELTWLLANTEFAGDGWNKYCLHATDGYCFDGQHEVTSWIEKLIRGGFNYFGYFEPELGWGWGGGRDTPGMAAVKGTAADVRQHCGWAHVASMDEVPKAMMDIMTGDKIAN